jgi:hypothetical protein
MEPNEIWFTLRAKYLSESHNYKKQKRNNLREMKGVSPLATVSTQLTVEPCRSKH